MRCFVAIDINDPLRQRLINLQKELAPLIIGNLVEPENLHFTLKFLGEINDEQVNDVIGNLSDIANNFEKFSIDLAGIGAFPSKSYIKVLWVGAPRLFNLQKAVCGSLESFGKERDITPHLTVARIKNVKDKNRLTEFFRKYENINFGTLTVSNIKLKKSELAAKGPIYEDVAAFDLSGA